MTVILADKDHPQRAMLERSVRDVFWSQYNARVPGFPSRLVATLDADGSPMAVAGLRFAEDGLFSQIYLDHPIEHVLSTALGRDVQVDQIVEFSSLAAARSGAAMPLVGAAIRLALAAGARYGLFTATSRLRALLRRSGISFVDLGAANPDRVQDAQVWGRYYLHDPRVLVVSADMLAGARQCVQADRLHA